MEISTNIRKAEQKDISRIAEIYVFNNRMSYYPIFNNVDFSFKELQVLSYADRFTEETLDRTYVYDDGVIKGFILVDGKEIDKLHIEYFFQSRGIGGALIEYAKSFLGVEYLWALEKNTRAISFYEKHGFKTTDERLALTGVNGAVEYCIKLSL